MAIDNPFDAVEKQYPDGSDVPFAELTLGSATVALGFPVTSPLAILFGFLDSFNTSARLDRGMAFIRVLTDHFKGLESSIKNMQTDVKEVQAALRVALHNDLDEMNDKKRDRYITVATSAVSLQTKVTDLVSFIRDVEQLGERDIIGLKVLNRVMNKSDDWPIAPTNVATTQKPKLHPNTFIQRAQEFSVQMAIALTNTHNLTPNDQFSREEGLQICLRLQGFGLAQEIATSPREVPISNYAARLTSRGLMLLKLLGEDVPNWDRYFGPNGPL
ncbi:hypothetical protein [Granulicella sp. L60]|uniref:hypothetical protein n=1 Tax=Granulicella sp. L60 TaxID=1641866 RepID=UPI00131DCEB9|nr:hypothetical protein [Granulicella sp. L60]